MRSALAAGGWRRFFPHKSHPVKATDYNLISSKCSLRQKMRRARSRKSKLFLLTWGVCRTWWGETHPQAASWTAAQRWAVSGLPAGRWRRTGSSKSSRPPPGCERARLAPRSQDSPASCRSICSNVGKVSLEGSLSGSFRAAFWQEVHRAFCQKVCCPAVRRVLLGRLELISWDQISFAVFNAG